jgi:hypothetical protein
MPDISNKVEAALNSLEGLQRAEAPAFFHTRVQARLENAMPSQSFWLPVKRPLWVVAVLAVLLVANISILSLNTNKHTDTNTAQSEPNNLQGFASSYGLDTGVDY